MRKLLAGAAALALGLAAATSALAQDFPNRQITIICGFAAGSGADIYARYYAKELEEATKQTVVVENKTGGFGSIAAVAAAKAKPDGYTLFIGGADTFTATPYVFKQPPFDPVKDFDYISPIFGQGFLLMVSSKTPYKTVAELTAALKEKGDKGSYATSNNVATILAEIYKQAAGLNTVQVRYKATADAVNDIASGSIDFIMSDPVSGLGRVRDGTNRALAISTAKPISAVPGVPPMADSGIPGVDLNIWWLIAAPAGTPDPVKSKLHDLFTAIATSQKTRDFVGKNGGEPLTAASPTATKAMVEKDIQSWATYVKVGKIEPQ